MDDQIVALLNNRLREAVHKKRLKLERKGDIDRHTFEI
jgi:hypothetical protein